MARRRRKKNKGGRKSKRYSVGDGVGAVGYYSYAKTGFEATKGASIDEKLRYGVRSGTGFDIKGEVPWSMDSIDPGAKLVGSAILLKEFGPKIPFVRALPRKLPLFGKYLRW